MLLSFRPHKPAAFTLIELLVTVSILAVLAAIALPNLLEAQTRGRLARVRADQRTLALALDAYAVDHLHYPPVAGTFSPSFAGRLRPLTTPLAYLAALPADPFSRKTDSWRGVVDDADPADLYGYNTDNNAYGPGFGASHEKWSLTSGGPDGRIEFPYYAFAGEFVVDGRYIGYVYDPTNGTVSKGEIFRRGGSAEPLPGLP